MTDPMHVRLVRTIPAPQKTVFEAWLDPVRLARFMRPAPGVTIPELEIDPRAGGKYHIVMQVGETRIPHHGEYREIDRYRRLVFTWLSPATLPSSVVTLTFEETGPRSTRLTLEHVGLPHEESRAAHEGGWTGVLETLGKEVAA